MDKPIDIFNGLLRFSENIRSKVIEGKDMLWDPVRQKYLVKQEEEFVRQLVLQFFISEKKWSTKLIQVEKQIDISGKKRRFDILLYERVDKAKILIECKSPKQAINQKTFDQITDYNIALKIPYLIVTNGIHSYLLQIDFDSKDYIFLQNIPEQN